MECAHQQPEDRIAVYKVPEEWKSSVHKFQQMLYLLVQQRQLLFVTHWMVLKFRLDRYCTARYSSSLVSQNYCMDPTSWSVVTVISRSLQLGFGITISAPQGRKVNSWLELLLPHLTYSVLPLYFDLLHHQYLHPRVKQFFLCPGSIWHQKQQTKSRSTGIAVAAIVPVQSANVKKDCRYHQTRSVLEVAFRVKLSCKYVIYSLKLWNIAVLA